MHERETKRRKKQLITHLDQNADDDTIAEWLDYVESLSDKERFAAYKRLFVNQSQALVEKVLSHISIIALMKLMRVNSFIIMGFLVELIYLNTDDLLEAINKLYVIGVLIFQNHRSFKDKELLEFWGALHFSVKESVLQAQNADVFSSLIVRASETLFKELFPYIEDNSFLSLMMHDDFELCRLFARSDNVELSLAKLKMILKNRFTESQKSIMLVLFKSAIKENAHRFFERYIQAYPDYFSILIMLNRCDLLITACNSPNELFLDPMLPRIQSTLRCKTLALIATWLSIELNTAQVVPSNHSFGSKEFSWSPSQAGKKTDKELKGALFGNFSQMRSKHLIPEIKRLQNELKGYRARDISDLSRNALPRFNLEEQHEDAVEYIVVETETLSANLKWVWVKSLDLCLSMSLKSAHYFVQGHQVHLGLSAAVRSRITSAQRPSMLAASLGFFTQFVNNVKQHIIVPVRVEEKAVVKIDPKVDLFTEDTDELICSHPLKRLVNYLLDNNAINKILAKAFKRNREGSVTYLRAVTVDCHLNQMPCEACLELAHSSQKKRTIISKIEQRLSSLRIPIDRKKLPLLFRISIESIENQNSTPAQLISAISQAKLTKPDSQLSPVPLLRQKEKMPSTENMPQLLVGKRKPPLRLFDLKTDLENRPPLEHFKARIVFQNPERANLKVFAQDVIVLNKLEIQAHELERHYSPPGRDYTVFEGSCTSN